MQEPTPNRTNLKGLFPYCAAVFIANVLGEKNYACCFPIDSVLCELLSELIPEFVSHKLSEIVVHLAWNNAWNSPLSGRSDFFRYFQVGVIDVAPNHYEIPFFWGGVESLLQFLDGIVENIGL